MKSLLQLNLNIEIHDVKAVSVSEWKLFMRSASKFINNFTFLKNVCILDKNKLPSDFLLNVVLYENDKNLLDSFRYSKILNKREIFIIKNNQYFFVRFVNKLMC